jgi:hypothetical protein
MDWKELGRQDKNSLQRLYGGGSLRICDPRDIMRLRDLGLDEGVDGRERLSPLGQALLDFTHARLNERLARRRSAVARPSPSACANPGRHTAAFEGKRADGFVYRTHHLRGAQTGAG